jgi:putative DNA primase/helicase
MPPLDLYESLKSAINRFVRVTNEESVAIALWVLHTYFIRQPKEEQVCNYSPVLMIHSPERGCGKTTLIEVLRLLVPRPMVAMNATEAALFRSIASRRPTLFLDEADSFLAKRQEILNIFNSGYERDGNVLRVVPPAYSEVGEFSTWGAKCISGIGNLSDTTESRSLKICLTRKLPGERLEKRSEVLRSDPDYFSRLRQTMVRFTLDYEEQMLATGIPFADDLDDRTQDNWSGLFRIAECIGLQSLAEAKTAALALSRNDVSEDSERIELLTDIRDLLVDIKGGSVSSVELCERLCKLVERPWATHNRSGLTPHRLSAMLKPFGIQTKQTKRAHSNTRQYHKDDFAEVFLRYLGK